MRNSFTDSVRCYREATTFLVCQVLVGLLAAWAVLSAVPAASQDVLPTLRSVRSSMPTPMTKAQLSDLLNRTVSQHPGWAMLRKDSGNNCPTPYPGVSVSCDWLVYAPTRWGYDILRDQEGAASIVESGGEAIAAGADLVYPWPVTGQPESPTTPPPQVVTSGPPAASVDYGRIDAALRDQVQTLMEQAERIRLDQMARDAEQRALLESLQAQLRAHDESPSWLSKVFGNRYTQLVMGAAAAWVTAQQTTK